MLTDRPAHRILQACLKYFAKCPCPHCRINKDKILEMGTHNDLYRRNRVRVDDNDLHFRIKLTRRWIFEQGVSLTSVYMKRMLDPLSITPTRVSSAQVCVRHMSLTEPSPECLLHPTASIRIQFLFTLRTRPASRVRIGRVEIGVHAPSPHSLCGRRRCDSRAESAVRSSTELYGCDTLTLLQIPPDAHIRTYPQVLRQHRRPA